MSIFYPTMIQRLLRGKSFVWTEVQETLDEVDCFLREVVERFSVDVFCDDIAMEARISKVLAEREEAGEQGVCKNADGPHV
jgi:hypothetical protein